MPSSFAFPTPPIFSASEILNYRPKKLAPEMSIMEAKYQILLQELQMILEYKPIALKGEDPEGIHKVRVGLRRLRTAINVFKPYFNKQTYKFLNDSTKSLAKELGNLRDLDVLQLHFQDYVQQFPNCAQYQSSWDAIYQNRYSIVSQTSHSHLISDSFDTLAATIFNYHQNNQSAAQQKFKQLPQTLKEFIPLQISKKFSKVQSYRKAITAFADYTPFHELRLKIKKFRYTLEFFEKLLDGPSVQHILELLVEIQDLLGNLNDAHTAEVILSSFKAEASDWPDCLVQYQHHRQEEFHALKNEFLVFWEKFDHQDISEIIENPLVRSLN